MIFVTGGAGYIGSHTCVELLNAGCDVTVFDNFCNSHPEALARVERITGKKLRLVRGDIRDRAALVAALRESEARAVIHFAGLKAVGESVTQPLAYYDNNVVGTLRLLEVDGGVRGENSGVQLLRHGLWRSDSAAASLKTTHSPPRIPMARRS